MECKGGVKQSVFTGFNNWNISRMECKDPRPTLKLSLMTIGIYPEWNVKLRPSD